MPRKGYWDPWIDPEYSNSSIMYLAYVCAMMVRPRGRILAFLERPTGCSMIISSSINMPAIAWPGINTALKH
jgi:hypothetical protein